MTQKGWTAPWSPVVGAAPHEEAPAFSAWHLSLVSPGTKFKVQLAWFASSLFDCWYLYSTLSYNIPNNSTNRKLFELGLGYCFYIFQAYGKKYAKSDFCSQKWIQFGSNFHQPHFRGSQMRLRPYLILCTKVMFCTFFTKAWFGSLHLKLEHFIQTGSLMLHTKANTSGLPKGTPPFEQLGKVLVRSRF